MMRTRMLTVFVAVMLGLVGALWRASSPQAALAAGVVQSDLMVSNTNASLRTGPSGGWEPSIAVNPANPSQVVVVTFYGPWDGSGGPASLFQTRNGGSSWTVHASIANPPGRGAEVVPPPNQSPNDQTIAFGRDGTFYGTFLTYNPANNAGNVLTGSSTNPGSLSAWQWNGNPVQYTNLAVTGVADQPQIIVDRDPVNAAQDDVYVGYLDDSQQVSHVAVSLGATPVNVTRDNVASTPTQWGVGTRLAGDPRNGTVYELHAQSNDGANNGAWPMVTTYRLNRSTDGGQTWSLNGDPDGAVIDTVRTSQGPGNSDAAPGYKFGGVDALLGGVHHLAVDPTSGDVYVVYGNDTGATGTGDQLFVRRITSSGSGVAVGPASRLSGAAESALPSVAVASDGTVGVLYDTVVSYDANGVPTFAIHFARSGDHGVTFSDQVLGTFASPAGDNLDPRQRILGDYQQLRAVGTHFYGVYAGDRDGFGSSINTIDPVFFRV